MYRFHLISVILVVGARFTALAALETARSKIAPEDFSAALSEAETIPMEQIMSIMDLSSEAR
jgi:hypothetical protein